MASTTPITEEQMKYLSVIATHTALMELGKLEEAKKNTEKQEELNNVKIIEFLKKYLKLIEYFEKSENLDTKTMNFGNPETFKEIINKSLEHIYKQITVIENNKIKYNKLQEENTELQKENKELIKETEELEETIENKQKLNNIRIEKLRTICGKRNNTIKILKKLLIIIIIHLSIISYIGFMNYYYTFVYSIVGIINIIYNIYYNIKLFLKKIVYSIYLLNTVFNDMLPFVYLYINI